MIDLHCHLLPCVDDGPSSLAESLEMARIMVSDGVSIAACTPHIMPGVYNNVGGDIRTHVAKLQAALEDAEIPLYLVVGADVHVAPNLVRAIHSGDVLTLHDSRYVLIEPPHHVPPPRIEDFFFDLMASGFQPILTHPERLTWIDRHFDTMRRLCRAGVWTQLTSGSLLGSFGQSAQYWALRMIDEGMCHILASDAHGATRRPPSLRAGFDVAANRVGHDEAVEMVLHRPYGILENRPPFDMTRPKSLIREEGKPPSGLLSRFFELVGGVGVQK